MNAKEVKQIIFGFGRSCQAAGKIPSTAEVQAHVKTLTGESFTPQRVRKLATSIGETLQARADWLKERAQRAERLAQLFTGLPEVPQSRQATAMQRPQEVEWPESAETEFVKVSIQSWDKEGKETEFMRRDEKTRKYTIEWKKENSDWIGGAEAQENRYGYDPDLKEDHYVNNKKKSFSVTIDVRETYGSFFDLPDLPGGRRGQKSELSASMFADAEQTYRIATQGKTLLARTTENCEIEYLSIPVNDYHTKGDYPVRVVLSFVHRVDGYNDYNSHRRVVRVLSSDSQSS